jgi:hypothetical protein
LDKAESSGVLCVPGELTIKSCERTPELQKYRKTKPSHEMSSLTSNMTMSKLPNAAPPRKMKLSRQFSKAPYLRKLLESIHKAGLCYFLQRAKIRAPAKKSAAETLKSGSNLSVSCTFSSQIGFTP